MDGFHDLEVWEGGKRALKPLLAFNGGEGEFEREGRWKGRRKCREKKPDRVL